MVPSLPLAIALVAPLPAAAAQNLIPSPYPSTSPGTAPRNPSAPSQSLQPTPYPQATPGSQGNPPNARIGGAQQSVPSTYQRNYGVEQH